MHSKRTFSNANYETSFWLFQTEDKAQFSSNEKDCAFLFPTNHFPHLEKRFQNYIKNKIIFLSYYYL